MGCLKSVDNLFLFCNLLLDENLKCVTKTIDDDPLKCIGSSLDSNCDITPSLLCSGTYNILFFS